MGPGHCSIISSHAVPPELWDPDTAPLSAHTLFLPSYGTWTLLRYPLRGCSKLWDPDTAPLSAHTLFLPSYGTRTLLHCQLTRCSFRVIEPGHCSIISSKTVPPELWDPDTAPLSAHMLFQVMGPGHCSIISSHAVSSYGTRTLLHYQLTRCSS